MRIHNMFSNRRGIVLLFPKVLTGRDYKTYGTLAECVYTFARMAGNKVVTLHQKSIRFSNQ